MATSATVRVRVLAFARLRDLFGFGEREFELSAGTTLDALWAQLAQGDADAANLHASTRFARNGALANGTDVIAEGDEIALMPPVGGG
ncbi:MAG: hypothetical protein NVS3B28_11980 [Candidatus Velthaea sp.]